MKKKALLVLLLAVAPLMVAVGAASAHPLGNFTINRYSLIDPSGGRIYVRYVLDMAEIPTFQARSTVISEGRAAYARGLVNQIRHRLELRVDGRPLPLRPLRHELAFPPGQAGLHTTRLEIALTSPPLQSGRQVRIVYRDENFADRIGWKEIVVRADAGAHVRTTSALSQTISEELRSYPKDLLQSPLNITRASATVVTGRGTGTVPALHSRAQLDQRVGVRAVADSGYAGLIARDKLSLGFVLGSLLIALFWGAAHAFSPGHGKSIIAAYLVGSRGTPRHALLLGLTVTVTHTIGVFALGLVTLSLSSFLLPDQLYPWLNLVSALLIVTVGVSVLRWRLRDWHRRRTPSRADMHDHRHAHPHDHDHGQGDPSLGLRRLLGIGISGGIIPCPTALVVLLAAISLHRVGYGLILILSFSVGLAGAMTGIGLLAVTAKRLFNQVNFDGKLLRLLPAISAVVVLVLGLAMTARALPRVI